VELETLLLVGCAWLLFGPRGSLSWLRGLLAGLLVGALLLTRFPYALALLLLFVASMWWHRASGWKAWRPLLVGMAIAGVLVAPHRIALALRHGDTGYDVHRTLRWIANQEFQGRPGFPSSEEVMRDPYAGPRMTLGQYYLGLHTPWEVAWRSVRGLGRAVLNLSPVGYVEEVQAVLSLPVRWVDPLVAVLGVIGLGVLAGRQDTRWIPFVLLLSLIHVAFFSDLGLPDYRFRMILQAMPFFAVGVIAGGHWVLARGVALLPGRSASWAARAMSAPLPTGKSR
jgi:hypothetical protein